MRYCLEFACLFLAFFSHFFSKKFMSRSLREIRISKKPSTELFKICLRYCLIKLLLICFGHCCQKSDFTFCFCLSSCFDFGHSIFHIRHLQIVEWCPILVLYESQLACFGFIWGLPSLISEIFWSQFSILAIRISASFHRSQSLRGIRIDLGVSLFTWIQAPFVPDSGLNHHHQVDPVPRTNSGPSPPPPLPITKIKLN